MTSQQFKASLRFLAILVLSTAAAALIVEIIKFIS